MIDTELFKSRVYGLKGKRTNETYGDAVGCDAKTVSTMINHGKVPGIDILKRMAEDGKVLIGWILGEASDINESGNKLHDDSGEISEARAIEMTLSVIRSKTVYKRALWENLKAFDKAVNGELEQDEMKEDIQEMKNSIKRLEQLLLTFTGSTPVLESEKKAQGNSH